MHHRTALHLPELLNYREQAEKTTPSHHVETLEYKAALK